MFICQYIYLFLHLMSSIFAKYIYVFNKASLLSPAMFGPMVFVQHVFYTSKCSVHLALPAARTVSTVWWGCRCWSAWKWWLSPCGWIEELQRRTADRVEPRRLMTPCTLQTSVNFIHYPHSKYYKYCLLAWKKYTIQKSMHTNIC